MAGHSGPFTPGGYQSTVIHTALAGIEPSTFRLLVRRTTSSATETTITTTYSFIRKTLIYCTLYLLTYLFIYFNYSLTELDRAKRRQLLDIIRIVTTVSHCHKSCRRLLAFGGGGSSIRFSPRWPSHVFGLRCSVSRSLLSFVTYFSGNSY